MSRDDSPVDPGPPPEAPSLGQQRTDLAYERSAEAAERTLMAGVRTAVSMISFGFTIAKFFQYLGKLTDTAASTGELGHAPYHLGLVLLGGGNLTLIFSLAEYVTSVRRLERATGRKLGPSAALFSALFLLLVGLSLTAVLAFELM